MVGSFAANGSWNVTVVTGSSAVGIFATDGSINVFNASAINTPVGAYHASGALNVVPTSSSTFLPLRHPNGSLYVTDGSSSGAGILLNRGQPVTVISGTLFGPPGFLLLVDGVSRLLLVDGSSKIIL